MEEIIADRYRLLEQIGSGGEARVFRARDLAEERDVAIRFPLKAGSGARTSVALPAQHAGWVKLLSSASDPIRGVYQVLELIEGETLQEIVQRKPLDNEGWPAFIRESMDAVAALHTCGWVHGDLNAGNFVQVRGTSEWRLLELPFLAFSPLDERSSAFGSIHTLAPEQLQGRPVDQRSDLYALGCLYYFAAAGEFPHAGSTRQELAISLLRFPPTPLSEKSPNRPAHLAAWVMGLLNRDPQARPASALEAQQAWRELAAS